MHATQARKRAGGHHIPFPAVPKAPPRRRWPTVGLGAALLVLAAIAGAAYLARDRRSSPPAPARHATVAVTEGPVAGALTLSGRLEFERTVRIGTAVSGQVVAVGAEVGQTVRRGQVLARLDDLEQRTALVSADVQRTMADLQLTRTELRLLDSAGVTGDLLGAVPLDELLENAEPEAQLDAMTAAAQLARQKALVRLARGQLAQRTVKAPADGVVLARSFDRGETIAASPPGPPLFILDVRPGHLLLRVQIDERHVSRVQAGPVRVVVPSHDRSLVGEVVGVTSPGDVGGANEGAARYQVDIAIDNADDTLRPGLSALVSLPMSSGAAALRVPRAAIDGTSAPRAGGTGGTSTGTLWLVAGTGPASPSPVEVGVTDGQLVEVSGPGLRPGMTAELLPPP
jgi:multidrug efflux pump subunit AcrA (membrane-fusion protein)